MADLKTKLEDRTGSGKLIDWALALGFDDGTLGNFLNGRAKLGKEKLKRLCEFLNVKQEDVLNPQPKPDEMDEVTRQSASRSAAEAGLMVLSDAVSEEQLRLAIKNAIDSGQNGVARRLLDLLESKQA